MDRVLIWDLPTRFFHWLLAAGFIAAAFIALALGEDSALFPYHAIIGLAIEQEDGLRHIAIGRCEVSAGPLAADRSREFGRTRQDLRSVGLDPVVRHGR